MCLRRVVHTTKFARAVKETKGSFKERMRAVADLLKEDAARPDGSWLIDLSLTLKGTSVSHGSQSRLSWRPSFSFLCLCRNSSVLALCGA